ncbi:MAG TPA: OmpA family protein [Gemmatimonadaceae bacterium]|nr:OmpA family protein [Gemmatimonadaceae bacterium]
MRALTVGIAALVWALPIAAQERGTMEFGAFASTASFDQQLSLNNAIGGGGRIGMFLDRRWFVEFEKAEMRATRPNGLRDVNVGVLSSRLIFIPGTVGATSFLAGLGAGTSTETNFMHTYGVGALAGVKVALGDRAAIRLDGTVDWLANQDWKKYSSVRLGMSITRRPYRLTRNVAVPGRTVMIDKPDSVSAYEIGRLRAREEAYRALRDSLNSGGYVVRAYTSAATLATMEAPILFEFNKFDLGSEAKAALDAKIAVARANPAMTIVMLGYTDVVGTDEYNMGLGMRRAQAAKDYIIAQGLSANRVIIETKGERRQIPGSAGVEGEAANRRAIFRLLIAPEVLQPK